MTHDLRDPDKLRALCDVAEHGPELEQLGLSPDRAREWASMVEVLQDELLAHLHERKCHRIQHPGNTTAVPAPCNCWHARKSQALAAIGQMSFGGTH